MIEYPLTNDSLIGYEIALEHREKAQEMIRAFNEKYQSRPQEQLEGMDAKYEQYVEEIKNRQRHKIIS